MLWRKDTKIYTSRYLNLCIKKTHVKLKFNYSNYKNKNAQIIIAIIRDMNYNRTKNYTYTKIFKFVQRIEKVDISAQNISEIINPNDKKPCYLN